MNPAAAADAIIIGGGLAGLATALELLERGRRVVVLERGMEAALGGLARLSFGGVIIVGSPEQRRARSRDDATLALADWTRFAAYGDGEEWPRRWAERYVNESIPEIYNWIKALGVGFFPVVHWVARGYDIPGNAVPRFHMIWGTGHHLCARLIARLRAHPHADKLSLHFGYHVQRLTTTGGVVDGCAGVDTATGEALAVRAQAIVVASGGLAGDLAWVRANWPASCGTAPERLLNGAHPFSDGTPHDAVAAIGEAYLAGIPLLVICGGIRRDSGRAYPLHDVDQLALVRGLTKGAWTAATHAEIVPRLYEAFELATSGEPGPVMVEIPVDVLMFRGNAEAPGPYAPTWKPPQPEPQAVANAVALLKRARKPALYLGWGASHAPEEAIRVAEILDAPVVTTLQGLGAFPGDHPLHAGMGFGPCAVPPARRALAGCDALLAVGLRFGELATGSYSQPVPKELVHVDINPAVFHKNYPARVAIEADAKHALAAIANGLGEAIMRVPLNGERPVKTLWGIITGGRDPRASILTDKVAHRADWGRKPGTTRVGPGAFFSALRQRLTADALLVADDGNHTFLAAELYSVHGPRGFISPSDYNAMGYAVPAGIGAKLARPDRQVVVVVGDGGFMMTGMELLTAAANNLGVIVCVFCDGELGQIAQFQALPLNHKACTVLPTFKPEGVALATGAAYIHIPDDDGVGPGLIEALAIAAKGRPVVVEVRIDYARKSYFTRGVVKANLARFPLAERARLIGRAIARRLPGGSPH